MAKWTTYLHYHYLLFVLATRFVLLATRFVLLETRFVLLATRFVRLATRLAPLRSRVCITQRLVRVAKLFYIFKRGDCYAGEQCDAGGRKLEQHEDAFFDVAWWATRSNAPPQEARTCCCFWRAPAARPSRQQKGQPQWGDDYVNMSSVKNEYLFLERS